MKSKDTNLYSSAEVYLNAPENMKNEVEAWYIGSALFLQQVVKNQKQTLFGGLGKETGLKIQRELRSVSVLDVCCGPGNFVNYLNLVCSKIEVTGIDTNEIFLRSARERFKEFGWQFLKEDATNFNLGRKFDFVVASSAYHHIEDKKKIDFLKNIVSHLSGNGKVIVCENFLPKYSNILSKNKAIKKYYKILKAYYNKGNANPEAIKAIGEVQQLELSGEEEHKVHFGMFKDDIKKIGRAHV